MTTSNASQLRIRNWEKWQSYRKDRGQPPWIKIHRCVMRNPEWVGLSDAERGQLVAMWLLAADNNGTIPASPMVIRKLCYLDNAPDVNKFKELGFICQDGCQHDVNTTPTRRQHDALETETETETETDGCSEPDSGSEPATESEIKEPVFCEILLSGGKSTHLVTESDVAEYLEAFPGIDVRQEIRKCQQWNKASPARRKTKAGIKRHIAAWLGRAQDSIGKNPRAAPVNRSRRDQANLNACRDFINESG